MNVTTYGNVRKIRWPPPDGGEILFNWIFLNGMFQEIIKDMSLDLFLDQTVKSLFFKAVFFQIGFSFLHNWIVSKMMFPKMDANSELRICLDETLSIYLC